MGWREWLKGKNDPSGRRHGGSAAENVSKARGSKPGNTAKKSPKKPKGNTGK